MILLAWLLADLITGIAHWFEDKCLNEKSKYRLIQAITDDNIRHHEFPDALCKNSLWKNIDTSAVIAWPLALGLYLLGVSPVIYMAVFFASFANIIHMWSHQNKALVPAPVRLLQKTGVFCSKNHHLGHHFKGGRLVKKSEAKIRYCVMTDWLNPVLDYLNVFDILEVMLFRGKK